MSAYNKVVWSEGLFLRPQHFQQPERYLEFHAHQRSLAAEPFFWGFRELRLDVAALAVGTLAMCAAREQSRVAHTTDELGALED